MIPTVMSGRYLANLLIFARICFSATTAVNATSYDFIVVGGGLSGLAVARRLIESGQSTVAIIERGYVNDGPSTQVPHLGNFLSATNLWTYTSEPEPFLKNTSHSLFTGSVVGGGSVVNGMGYTRGSRAEYDAWRDLGNPNWGWDGIIPYFRKSTNFTVPSAQTTQEFNVTWNMAGFGGGPVQLTVPDFQYTDIKAFWEAWRAKGIPTPQDGANGDTIGAYWMSTTVDKKLGIRSHSRRAYYDPVASNPNIHLFTGQIVSELIFEDTSTKLNTSQLSAVGVKMMTRQDNKTSEIFARKEIILAAGAVNTPAILQRSGVGPSETLQRLKIPVKLDKPAVGANFQDHPVVSMLYELQNATFPHTLSLSTNATFNASAWQQYLETKSGPYASAQRSGVTFLSLPLLTSDHKAIVSAIRSQNPLTHLPPIYKHKALLAGYTAQFAILAHAYTSNTSAVVEFPFESGGFAFASLQRPLSRGTITIRSRNAFDDPAIHFNALANPVDKTILLAAVRYNREHWAAPQLAHLLPLETAPGAQYQSDEQLFDALVAQGILEPSWAHPSGTCAMMPEELGGCVDAELRVYGVEGLSVVDASVLPMIVGAHLQATMYAVAEKAADIIRVRHGIE